MDLFWNVGIAGEDGGEIAGRHGGENGKINGQIVLDDFGEFDGQRVLDGFEREFADRNTLFDISFETHISETKSSQLS